MYAISFISTWLKDIVILFVIISIAELIMPKGNMKKYINMVIGLLIIFTIISPFAKLLKLNFNFEQTVFNYSKPNIIRDIEENQLYIQQEKQIEKIYKEKISKEITELIQEKTDYIVVDINIEIKTGKETYGEIDYLDISIGQENNDRGKIHIGKVKPVEIQNNTKAEEVSHEGYEDIKKLVSNSYLVDIDKINIKWIEKGKGE